jgi:uncharacterized membrane protein
MRFIHPYWLLAALPALAWVFWLGWRTEAQLNPARKWLALTFRAMVTLAILFALAGLQWLRPVEGMNVFFVLDRSDSIPSEQQEAARGLVNVLAGHMQRMDKAGVIVFGTDASIDRLPNEMIKLDKIDTVVDTQRTDLAAAIRLATAAFPETGQKRIVLMSDGNENIGDALAAVAGARAQGATVDVVPMGVSRGNDVFVQKVQVPARLKKGQPFEAKIFVQADQAQTAAVRLYRNEQFLGEQKVRLEAGKNLFTFPQTLPDAGFYSYDVRVDAPGDPLPQNNRAAAFASVQGDPRVLIISSEPDQDQPLAAALKAARLDVILGGLNRLPNSLAEMDSYDAIFLSNVSAGDLGRDTMALLESAVRDFGVGLVCVGGDQAYAAGGYRNTPLETTLPVSMELDSKKVLPRGAVVLVMHGMEFANGNQVARDCALGVLGALGPDDELGVVLWDGTERWVQELKKVGDKREAGRNIAGMNQGDMPSFQGPMEKAHDALKKSTANLKHIIVFSDGDPGQPSTQLMQQIVNDRITVSTVLIAGHSGPQTMIAMAEQGHGRFYNVTSPNLLPQIFIKETAVILKSAIYEEPFKPQVRSVSEVIRGIGPDYPQLLGYVATTEKPRAETPLWTHKGDPLLAHWQFGLGRAVAFTSDARPKWAKNWLGWERYRQFWSQIGQWSLRRLENADFTTEVTLENGQGVINVEALDEQGNYRNFLDLQAIVASPKGESQTVRLEQKGPGHYEARFPTKEVGSYLLNVVQREGGRLAGRQTVGASVNFSPEFASPEPNLNLLRRIAETGGGKMLDPNRPGLDNPFQHDRVRTRQPQDLWEWLLKLAVILFVLDVGVRRIQIDREEWLRATASLRRWIFFWQGAPRTPAPEESLATLLARRDQVRGARTAPGPEARPELFQPQQPGAPAAMPEVQPAAPPVTPATPPAAPPADESKPVTTTSRLLEAKRRAQSRRTQ